MQQTPFFISPEVIHRQGKSSARVCFCSIALIGESKTKIFFPHTAASLQRETRPLTLAAQDAESTRSRLPPYGVSAWRGYAYTQD